MNEYDLTGSSGPEDTLFWVLLALFLLASWLTQPHHHHARVTIFRYWISEHHLRIFTRIRRRRKNYHQPSNAPSWRGSG